MSFLIEKLPRLSSLHRSLSRGDLGLFLLACFSISQLEPLSNAVSLLNIADALARQNLFFVLAVSVAGWRFLLSDPAIGLSWSDWIIVAVSPFLFGLVCFFGVYQLAGAAFTLLLIPLVTANYKDTQFKSALIVCGALAINSFWGPLVFQTFTAPIIAFDTTLLGWAYALLRPDIQQHGA
ncbi:MAG: hypothetical protein KGO94_11680, partial [Alphaproteobacteria bacterium]|nr:hypothetical protein [Alphaproteobacteria bacterium]